MAWAIVLSFPEMTERILFVTGDVIGTEPERFLAKERLPLVRERSG